jgi:hypothetical protein
MQEEIIQKGNGRDCRRHVLKGYNEMKGRSPSVRFYRFLKLKVDFLGHGR